MSVRQLRLDRGWSQEHLSQISGLSVRTIQRIEQGNKAGLESLKSLAAVFDVQVTDLSSTNLNAADMSDANIDLTGSDEMDSPLLKDSITEDKPMQETSENQQHEKAVVAQVRRLKAFYKSLAYYVCIVALLFIVNLVTNPDYIWAIWPALGWGIAIVLQGLSAFDVLNFFGSDWEKKQIEKRLGKNQD